MALISIADAIPYPSLVRMPGSGISAVLLIDAVNEEAAQIFIAPKTGNILKLHFCTGTVTTGATVIVALKTLDALGDPSAVVASETLAIANADDNKHLSVTLDPVGAVVQGTAYSLSVAEPAAGSGNMTIASYLSAGGSNLQILPYSDLYSGAPAWVKNYRLMAAAVEYDTGEVYNIGAGLFVNSVRIDVINASSPDEVGNIFQVPVICRAVGVYLEIAVIAAGADYTLTLYDSDGTSVLGQAAIDGDARSAILGVVFVQFPSVTLQPGTSYRVAFRATAASAVSYHQLAVEANADLAIVGGGSSCYHTGRTWNPGPGVWTDTNTQRVKIGVLLDAFDNAAQLGGGFPVLGGSVVR